MKRPGRKARDVATGLSGIGHPEWYGIRGPRPEDGRDHAAGGPDDRSMVVGDPPAPPLPPGIRVTMPEPEASGGKAPPAA